MSQLKPLISDLRDRKLWPVAILLVAALVAVPVLLSSNTPAPPAQPLPSLATRVSASAAVPSVTINGSPVQAPVTGKARDPFVQQPLPAPKPSPTASTSTASLSGGASAGSSTASGSGSSSTSAGTGSSSPASGGTVVAPVLPVNPQPSSTHPAPAPGLTSTEAYRVQVSLTDPAGNLTTPALDVRDSVFPNAQPPLLVYLGVLSTANRALFAVLPGTALSGRGTCIPGPLDCEVVSLAVGETENVSTPATASDPYSFAVEHIGPAHYASAAAASAARGRVSSAGQSALSAASLSAVSLFQFDPSIGALVDQRNLTVGGN